MLDVQQHVWVCDAFSVSQMYTYRVLSISYSDRDHMPPSFAHTQRLDASFSRTHLGHELHLDLWQAASHKGFASVFADSRRDSRDGRLAEMRREQKQDRAHEALECAAVRKGRPPTADQVGAYFNPW